MTGARTKRLALPAAGLAVVSAAVFGRSVGHGFLFWDDRGFIAGNPLIAHPSARNLLALWTRPLLSLLAPLTYTLWTLVSTLAGLRPWAFHLTNVVLHCLNAWAVLALLARIGASREAALAGALLFAVHPLQTETVAWASETKDLLAALLSLVAIGEYVRFWEVRTRAAYVRAAAAFALALLAKPSAVVTPVLVVVLGRAACGRGWRDSIRGLTPWFAAAATWTVVAIRVQPSAERLRYVAPVWLRPAVALDTLTFYLEKLVLPVGLAPDYGRTSERLVASGALTHGWIPAAALLAATWILRRRLPALAVGVALFVAALLPVLGLVPFDFQQYSNVADHYVYLAMLGPAVGLALVYRDLPRVVRRILPVALVTLACASFAQTSRWKDDVTLYAHTLTVNPRSAMAENNTGQVLEERGRLDEALVHYRRALELDPGDDGALNNVGNVLYKQGRYEDAIAHYREVLGHGGGHTQTLARMHNNLGAAYLKTERYDEAVDEFRLAIAIDPDYVEPYYNLGLVLTAFGRRAEAIEVLGRGLALDPSHAALRAQLRAAESGTGP